MQFAYSQQEARAYLGLSYEAFRLLAKRLGIEYEIDPADHRTKLYRAEEIERMKFALRRPRRMELLTVLQADYAPQFGEQVGRQFAQQLGEKIAVVQLLAPTTHTYVRRYPKRPVRPLVELDLYQVTPGVGPRAAQPTYLENWKRLQSWLITLSQRYPRVVVQVAAGSSFTDLVLMCSQAVCLVMQPGTTKAMHATLAEVETPLLIANELRRDEGASLEALILAGLRGNPHDLRIHQRLKKVAPGLLVSVESRAVSEFFMRQNARNAKTRAGDEGVALNEAVTEENKETSGTEPFVPLGAAVVSASAAEVAGGEGEGKTTMISAPESGAQEGGERTNIEPGNGDRAAGMVS